MSTVLTNISDNIYGYEQKENQRLLFHYALIILMKMNRSKFLTQILCMYSILIEEFFRRESQNNTTCFHRFKVKLGRINSWRRYFRLYWKTVKYRELIYIEIIGIRDITRPEVPEPANIFRSAWVRSRMITGDSKIAALVITKELGILAKEYIECSMK